MRWYHPISVIATWFGSGLAPKAPGTVGTLAALPFAYVIQTEFGIEALSLLTVLVFLVGWAVSNVYMVHTGKMDDPKEIVIDEVAGMWFVISSMPLMWLGPTNELILQLYAVSFVLFRLFDIWKPWPVSWADRKIKGGLGVMMDDLLAAIYALLLMGAAGHLLAYVGLVEIDLSGDYVQ